ncbi:MAG: hypothetical protein HC923_07170 [Myxococcales bacterium]|nr:hypothetical protein [Myxococcales bacterium]
MGLWTGVLRRAVPSARIIVGVFLLATVALAPERPLGVLLGAWAVVFMMVMVLPDLRIVLVAGALGALLVAPYILIAAFGERGTELATSLAMRQARPR